VGGWQPNGSLANGATGGAWGRRDDHTGEPHPTVDICWDREGHPQPLGMEEQTEQEKEVCWRSSQPKMSLSRAADLQQSFSTSVNSPLKPPAQGTNKENVAKDGSIRKSSISQAQSPGAFGLSALNTSRPSNRRRDTGEGFSKGGGFSPVSASRFSRDEPHAATPPPSLLRRTTDFKDAGNDETDKDRPRDQPEGSNSPFGTLKRSTTAPFTASLNQPSSPWSAGPQSGGFSPMGAFGNFAAPPASATSEKRPGFGSMRGESRFKGLMSKESGDDLGRGVIEKQSSGSLNKGGDVDSSRQLPSSWMEARSNRPMSNDTDPFPDDELRAGSAALGGQDASPPAQYGTPHRQNSGDNSGFGAFGMTADQGFHQLHQQTPQHGSGNEPMSPTNTNPYQSPDQDRSSDVGTEDTDLHQSHLAGSAGFGEGPGAGMAPFGNLGGLGRLQTGHDLQGTDRSQTSSAGPNRGFTGLGALGGLGGLSGLGGSPWSSAIPTAGTPSRDRGGFGSPFGEGPFGAANDMQSPSLPGLGLGNNMPFGAGPAGGFGGHGTIGRGASKMGSLFPTAMQEQMRSNNDPGMPGDGQTPGAFGRNAFGASAPGSAVPTRETDSPSRQQQLYEEYMAAAEGGQRGPQDPNFPGGDSVRTPFGQPPSSGAHQSPALAASSQGQGHGMHSPPTGGAPPPGTSASSQPPTAQQRTMVMPDRMRWIYRDPQGNTQGPWSGLEMHDWYRAGFFSADLLVKKYEDPDYEPLAQLIRRIGNSREPFLVPQIGIPHGPPPPQGAGWQAPLSGTGPNQPPLANSFPSFGTTLTAEQQNALERRKQEEQYLMARQKEVLAAHQAQFFKTLQGGVHPQQLQHHSSAHSLHSQPSFGSITSPSGFQPSPQVGSTGSGGQQPGFFDNSFRPGPGGSMGAGGPGGLDMLRNIREEDLPAVLEQLNLGRGGAQGVPGAGPFGQSSDPLHEQQVAAMLNDRARLLREAEQDALQRQMDPNEEQAAAQASADRLNQFHEYRAEAGDDEQSDDDMASQDTGAPLATEEEGMALPHAVTQQAEPLSDQEPLSLTEQVQKAASAKQSPAPASPWAKVDSAPLQPFPPPQSSSPLPAPAAQRKQNVAESLAAGSRSRSETPAAETPTSIAPWAKEPAEAPKGPSLKEIQEAEARKAAQAEALAAAARREAMEKEIAAAQQAAAPAPGLPASSTWASSASPSNSTQSAWAKPFATKAAAGPAPGSTKKTLQQIQKEEEARKLRAAAAAASASPTVSAGLNPAPPAGGKRYADLASKTSPSTGPAAAAAPPAGGAWTTVGASGKVKGSAGPIPTGPSAGVRAASSSAVPTTARPKPTVTTGGRAMTGGVGAPPGLNPMDEVRKWAISELRGDLKNNVGGKLPAPFLP
jgi:PERQ amino acid-rich with GYF domain-containing protein